jgi:release factor glutamine methyltransferase
LLTNGCVGEYHSPGTVPFSTGRFSIGHTGLPLVRSKTYSQFCLVGCAIALSLAAEFPTSGPELEVWATDASPGALEVLAQNLEALAVMNPGAAARVRVATGSWFDALPAALAGHVHLVVSNPPYVSEAEWRSLDPSVRDHEPAVALVPGPTGLEAIEALLGDAPGWLAPGGSLVLELAPWQAAPVRARAQELGYVRPVIGSDLTGRPRMLVTRSAGG